MILSIFLTSITLSIWTPTPTNLSYWLIAPLFALQYESYYDHTFYSDRDSLTWNLDYDKTSDFDDVVGHWHVEDHPSTLGKSRVFYACDIKMKGSVPKPILNYISKAALKQATGWVKRESERFPDGDVPAQYAGVANKMSFGRKWNTPWRCDVSRESQVYCIMIIHITEESDLEHKKHSMLTTKADH